MFFDQLKHPKRGLAALVKEVSHKGAEKDQGAGAS
jgi:hypothetical protein